MVAFNTTPRRYDTAVVVAPAPGRMCDAPRDGTVVALIPVDSTFAGECVLGVAHGKHWRVLAASSEPRRLCTPIMTEASFAGWFSLDAVDEPYRSLASRLKDAVLRQLTEEKRMTIELGAKAKDKISGFVGIVTGRVEYITGCNQLLINPGLDKDGKMQSSEWIDEQRLEQVGEEVIRLDNGRTPGCDVAPPRR